MKTFEERFWDRVDKRGDDDCWPWTGEIGPKGYGRITCTIKNRSKKKRMRAHRVSYELNVGEIPEGKLVCHSCDNPICVNPEHLWVGTNLENVRDMVSKNRHKVREGNKHEKRLKMNSLDCYGEKHPQSKLSNEVAKKIKERSATEKTSKLAKEFGVSMATVSNIKHGRTWKKAVEQDEPVCV